jgi:hypothetical protein
MRHTTLFGFASALSAAAAFAPRAEAQTCPPTAAVFMFDQSNSMNDPGMNNNPKREIALTKALNDYNALGANTPVGVYGFGNNPQFAQNYTHTYIAVDPVNPKKKGVNDALIIGSSTTEGAFQLARDATITGNWWTPLAGAACDSIQIDLTNLVDGTCLLTTTFQLYLYSDGIENSTPGDPGDPAGPGIHPCSGPDSTTMFDNSKAGLGFGLTPQSWQWHMANTAYTGDPNTLVQGPLKFVFNVSLLFDFTNSLAGGPGVDGHSTVTAGLQDVTPQLSALMSGLAAATNGSYFEAKKVNGVPAVFPMPGDTDPSPARSCVDSADLNRVTQALGHKVKTGDPTFSVQDLALRDVNNDLIVNTADYLLVLKYMGKCST